MKRRETIVKPNAEKLLKILNSNKGAVKMELKALSLEDMEPIRQWRNSQLEILRTSYPLTQEMQEQFYHDVVCNRYANARFWGIVDTIEELSNMRGQKVLIGMAGIENIQWENKIGEISLILNPKQSNNADLRKALVLILDKGFNCLNLENLHTEVYSCNLNREFWLQRASEYLGYTCKLPNRKYWQGNYCESMYINFNKELYQSSLGGYYKV